MVMVNVGDRVRVSKGVTSSNSNSSSSSSSSTSSKLAGKEGHVVGAAKGKQCTVSIDGKEHKISLKDLVVVADGDNDGDGNGSDDGDDGDDGEGDDDDDDDDENDGEDDDVDDLVSRTLRKFAASSASTSQAQACSSLRSSLTRAGRLQGKQMMSRGGVVSMKASAAGRQNNAIEAAQARSTLYNPSALVAPPLNAEKVAKPTTVGKGWFDLEPLKMDEKLKRDIKVIQMRNYLDPKRFYKNPDRVGKVCAMD